jgi:hypothetical protein
MSKRAFRTQTKGLPTCDSIVATESHGRARYITFATARECGYKVTFADIRVTRSPEFDQWAERQATGSCWTEEYVRLAVPKGKLEEKQDETR